MSEKYKLVEVVIPCFPGFYESELSDLIDRAVDDLFDYEGNGDSKSTPKDFWDHVKYQETELNVAQLWLEGYQRWLKNDHDLDIPLKWAAMESPKEYNFTTDRVFVNVKLNDVAKVFRRAGKDDVAATARKMFTSYDGFISFYDSDIRDWGKFSTWDHNQFGAVFAALGDQEDMDIMYDCNCNGEMDNALVLTEAGRSIADAHYSDSRKLEEWQLLAK